mmetsp:Transcript_2404/g.6968  ORF Transcript_2404/g.6968 Transcript_2404/m.6968 type:complete len:209 (-) Transcript_2404:501-1127(-)
MQIPRLHYSRLCLILQSFALVLILQPTYQRLHSQPMRECLFAVFPNIVNAIGRDYPMRMSIEDHQCRYLKLAFKSQFGQLSLGTHSKVLLQLGPLRRIVWNALPSASNVVRHLLLTAVTGNVDDAQLLASLRCSIVRFHFIGIQQRIALTRKGLIQCLRDGRAHWAPICSPIKSHDLAFGKCIRQGRELGQWQLSHFSVGVVQMSFAI